jgi:hypothetical protein
MIVWGGYDHISLLNTGGRYCAQSGSQTPTPTPTPTPTCGPPATDFKHDNKPDYVLYNGGTRQNGGVVHEQQRFSVIHLRIAGMS